MILESDCRELVASQLLGALALLMMLGTVFKRADEVWKVGI